MTSISPIKYQEYPECMFAMISAFLPVKEGRDLRRVSGSITFRHNDVYGNTYKNGTLHSFDDQPAYVGPFIKEWYKNGILHRERDLPAVVIGDWREEWWINGKRHRDGDLPAVITENEGNFWYKDGKLIK